jgi:hypothetical protein
MSGLSAFAKQRYKDSVTIAKQLETTLRRVSETMSHTKDSLHYRQ